jgi:tetratricopeptide (TPR) repeat protein
MERKLKTISQESIPEAISKAEHYRHLNEPEESESICHDILAVDPENQTAMRILGLAITDEFRGGTSDRYIEAEKMFQRLSDPYQREYHLGLLAERRAKAQMRAGHPPRLLTHLFEEAIVHFERAERLSPPKNDDAMLRWNRCVRLLDKLPAEFPAPQNSFEDDDTAPIKISPWKATAK